MDHSYDNVTPRIGDAVPRKEDLRLLTGAGSFSDDVNLDGQVYAVMVRSPHAHARIIDVEIAEALAVPGVLAVFTGADAMEDGLAPVPHLVRLGASMDIMLENRDGSEHHRTPHFVLPADKARFVGEALVMVIGETEAAARDGAEQVSIEYEPLPSVTGTAAALTDGAPLVWDDEAATNLCVDADVGDEAATDAAFAGAAHVVRLETWIRRVTGVTMKRKPAVTPCMPAAAEPTVRSVKRLRCSASMRTKSATSPAMWAAISAPATRSIPNSPWSPGRRAASAGP